MLTIIPQVLPRDEALALGRAIAAADWVDGSVTSGPAAARVKRNRQLPEDGEAARTARQRVQQALSASALFLSAALPKAIYPPLFNRYGPGEQYGDHVDNALRIDPATGARLRTDLRRRCSCPRTTTAASWPSPAISAAWPTSSPPATWCSTPRPACIG
jgi:PKHD-type hydroxylase